MKVRPDHDVADDLAEYFATITRPRFNRLDLIELIKGLTALANAWKRREAPTDPAPADADAATAGSEPAAAGVTAQTKH